MGWLDEEWLRQAAGACPCLDLQRKRDSIALRQPDRAEGLLAHQRVTLGEPKSTPAQPGARGRGSTRARVHRGPTRSRRIVLRVSGLGIGPQPLQPTLAYGYSTFGRVTQIVRKPMAATTKPGNTVVSSKSPNLITEDSGFVNPAATM